MSIRSRARQHVISLTGGGGGGPSPTGNLLVGPDFGEGNGNDDNTFSSVVSVALTALKFVTNLSATISTKLSRVVVGVLPSGTTSVSLAGTAVGAPYWQSQSTVSGSSLGGGLIVVTKPSGTQEGDLLVAFAALSAGGSNFTSTPSGWTLQDSNTTSGTPSIWCYTKVASGGEPSSYSWTSSGSGTLNHAIGIHRIAGVHATPINATANSGASANNPVASSVTTTANNCLILHGVAQTSSSTAYSFTPPSGYEERWDVSGGTALPISMTSATRVRPTGATGAQTYTSTAAISSQYATVTLAVRPGTVTL